jgi:phosphoribosyl 1,2-cyclic phosphodiesterase
MIDSSSLRFVCLGSGSSGNAYCVCRDDSVLLIDCGFSFRELVKRCDASSVDPRQIKAALFTHNHGDHIKGVAKLHKTLPQVELFASPSVAEAISAESNIPEEEFVCFEYGQDFEIGTFGVRAFHVPHDTPDCSGYLISAGDWRYFHATDVGTAMDSIGEEFSMAHWATLEFNHDCVMLSQSSRPESLKRRIRGGRGHLSNDAAAEFVKKFASPHLRRIFLAHLSRDCNCPHLAENALRQV